MDEKDVLAGEYRKSPVCSGYHIFAPASHIQRWLEDAIFRFYETKKDDPIMAAANLFGNIINIQPFEDGNGRICLLILAHVLIQIKCCLFPVILSSFHRRGRRHYIRAVKMFDREPSMVYIMIVKSLTHCWDNFEQTSRMLVWRWSLISNTSIICRRPPTDQHDLAGARNLIKMSSLMPFAFNTVELYVATINEKSCTPAREVCKAWSYEKAARRVVRHRRTTENIQQKHQLAAVPTVGTTVNWPRNSKKLDLYIIEEGMYELLFSSQQPKAKDFRRHCCNVLFP